MLRRSFLFCAPVVAAARNWPSFRGPNASGVSGATGIPVSWDIQAKKNLTWRTALPGVGHSSPVVWGDRIYITAAVAADPKLQGKPSPVAGIDSAGDVSPHAYQVVALDTRTGKIVWDRVVHQGTPKIKRHVKASHANPTAATDGRVIVAFFGSEGLHALDVTGKVLWSKDLGVLNVGLKGERNVQWGFASSPVLFENLAIVQCDTQDKSFVAAFNARTGQQKWTSPRQEYPAWSTPVLYTGPGGPILITSGSRQTRGLDPRTGKELWSYADETEVKVPAPVLAGDKVVITGGYPAGRRFFALNARTGKPVWENAKGGPYTTTPVAHREYLYICSDRGVMSCHTVADGKLVYQERIGRGGSYSASPVIAGDRIYVGSEDGEINVMRSGPKFELLGTNTFPEGIWATPAFSERTMYVRTAGALYAIGAS